MCCCNKILKLCNVGTCEGSEIVLPVVAGRTDEFTLVLSFLNTEYHITQEILSDENLRFSTTQLNENYTYTGKVYDSEKNLVPIILESGEEFDCIEFETVPVYAL